VEGLGGSAWVTHKNDAGVVLIHQHPGAGCISQICPSVPVVRADQSITSRENGSVLTLQAEFLFDQIGTFH
jgi:hypothetical protein